MGSPEESDPVIKDLKEKNVRLASENAELQVREDGCSTVIGMAGAAKYDLFSAESISMVVASTASMLMQDLKTCRHKSKR